MPETIIQLQADITVINEQIAADALLLLKAVDMKKVLDDPNYLKELSQEFIRQHMDDIKKGLKIGDEFADLILKNKALRDQQNG